jgi:Flp pilus assembly protein TadG
MARWRERRGVGLLELLVVLPLFLLCVFASVDTGRLIYCHQLVVSLCREAASLVSRGSTDAQTIAATQAAEAPLHLETAGRAIITTIRRRSTTDGAPWVITQTATGGLTTLASRVGSPGGPAAIPGISELAPGITVRAVEIAHRFRPVLIPGTFGIFYPDMVYDVAYF